MLSIYNNISYKILDEALTLVLLMTTTCEFFMTEPTLLVATHWYSPCSSSTVSMVEVHRECIVCSVRGQLHG